MTVLGGLLGVVLGVAGIVVTNRVSRELVDVTVAVVDVRLLAAGILVAVTIGILSAAYPLWLSRRTSVVEVMDG